MLRFVSSDRMIDFSLIGIHKTCGSAGFENVLFLRLISLSHDVSSKALPAGLWATKTRFSNSTAYRTTLARCSEGSRAACQLKARIACQTRASASFQQPSEGMKNGGRRREGGVDD